MADYIEILKHGDIVFIVDLDNGGRSVTNDAEAVWAEVQSKHPGSRLVYRDSMGRWDEIVEGCDFRPYHGDRPAVEVCEVCEQVFRARDRCTNGRCPDCHRQHCTPGGETSPGHGRGKAVVSETRVRELRKKYGCAS